jgi:hypothetical protein
VLQEKFSTTSATPFLAEVRRRFFFSSFPFSP